MLFASHPSPATKSVACCLYYLVSSSNAQRRLLEEGRKAHFGGKPLMGTTVRITQTGDHVSGAGHRNTDFTLRAHWEGKVLFWQRDQSRWLRRARKILRWKGIYLALKNLCPNSLIELNVSCTSTNCLPVLALSHWSPTQRKKQSLRQWDPLWANTPAEIVVVW